MYVERVVGREQVGRETPTHTLPVLEHVAQRTSVGVNKRALPEHTLPVAEHVAQQTSVGVNKQLELKHSLPACPPMRDKLQSGHLNSQASRFR